MTAILSREANLNTNLTLFLITIGQMCPNFNDYFNNAKLKYLFFLSKKKKKKKKSLLGKKKKKKKQNKKK